MRPADSVILLAAIPSWRPPESKTRMPWCGVVWCGVVASEQTGDQNSGHTIGISVVCARSVGQVVDFARSVVVVRTCHFRTFAGRHDAEVWSAAVARHRGWRIETGFGSIATQFARSGPSQRSGQLRIRKARPSACPRSRNGILQW